MAKCIVVHRFLNPQPVVYYMGQPRGSPILSLQLTVGDSLYMTVALVSLGLVAATIK